MGAKGTSDTERLLRRAREGDKSAVDGLLERYRRRLRQMVAVRMDPRLSPRVDASDVVQEAIIEAAAKLPGYLQDRPLPFYAWLRQLAWERLVDLHRFHVQAQKRSVSRELPMEMTLSDQSEHLLADRLATSGTRPSQRMVCRELKDRIRQALAELPPRDREVLVLIYLEQLSVSETASVLELNEKAVTMRHLRALDRIRNLLSD